MTPASDTTHKALSRRIKQHVIGRPQDFYTITLPGLETLCRGELAALEEKHQDNTIHLGHELEALTGLEARVTILGYLQRGGTPSAGDRLLATRLGTACADLIAAAKGSDTALIVTGDHGLIDVSPQNHTDLGRLPELQEHLAQPLCGERRVAYCHLREAGSDAFVSAAGDILGERFLPRSSRELVEEGWFGPGAPGHGDWS